MATIITPTKKHLLTKRAELITYLIDDQQYTKADVGVIFSLHRSTVMDIYKAHKKAKSIIIKS